ncbi:MAG TPA: hypothetical protein VND20_07250 [Candidatus Binataceae bacterium]|nr:hypothetical protein [Candidatus Binataceae bacterium]
MEIKVKRTNFPAAMRAAVAEFAAAMTAGDEAAAAAWMSAAARDALAAFARTAPIRPWTKYAVIAEARLGFQYIVKVRFAGAAGSATMQCRWACTHGDAAEKAGAWRIVELDDLGVHSPWKRPTEAEIANAAKRRPEYPNG